MASGTKAAGESAARLPAELESRTERARPLDAALRAPMERSFGASLGDVLVHTDTDAAASADRLDAKAYAVGRHVVFGPGRYDPHSDAGRALIGHELAHVVQQRRGGAQPRPSGVHPAGTAAEGAAHSAGARAAAGMSAPVAGGTAPGVSRAPKGESDEEAELARLKAENRHDAMVSLGVTEGVVQEVTGLADTVVGLAYAAHDVEERALNKAASALGLTDEEKNVLHLASDLLTGGAALDALRDKAKASGWVDPYTGAPAISPKVTAAGDWLEAHYDKATGSKAPESDDLFTDRELSQIAGSLGVQTILAFTGVEEVALAAKVVGPASSAKSILDAINLNPEDWPHDVHFWAQVVGAVLNVAGLGASSAGRKLAALLIDAALTTLSVAPAVRKLWTDRKGAQGADREAVLRQDLKDVVRALISVLHQIVLHAATYRRSKAPGAAPPAGGKGGGGTGGEEHAGPPRAKQPQPPAEAHPAGGTPPTHAPAGPPAPAHPTPHVSTPAPATPHAAPPTAPGAAPQPVAESAGKAAGKTGKKAAAKQAAGKAQAKTAAAKASSAEPVAPAPAPAAGKQAAGTKAAAQQGAAKKSAAKSSAAKKSVAKKSAAKKSAAKQATPEQTAPEQALLDQATATNPAVKKTAVKKKTTAKKATAEQAAPAAPATTTQEPGTEAMKPAATGIKVEPAPSATPGVPKAAKAPKATKAGGKGKAPEAPRQDPNAPFDPKLRRPSLRGLTDLAAVDRHTGVRTNPDARVSVFHDPLGSQVAPVTGDTPQQQGHDFERALKEDLLGGGTYRERHEAADKPRIGDIGSYEAKHMTDLGSEELDQVWRDLVARDRAVVIMPKAGDGTIKNLALLAAQFEKMTGRRPTIAVRETSK
ncbi:DUF4157 domain-containing protein [Embleya sp. AB8]|uniref:eCIS core domain-containing protein n=1 Tax=Embleya sp. AB8 TaxID=3156304 RepID=UPI003C775D3F